MEEEHKCNICTRRFLNKSKLTQHLKISHEQTIGFSCNICQKVLCSKLSLTRHMKLHDDGNRDHICEICGSRSISPGSLKIHIQRKHEPSARAEYQCDQCPKIMRTKNGFKQHMNTHEKVNIYKCEVCEKQFYRKYAMTLHRSIHENQNVQCQECQKFFNRQETLKMHIRRHHNFSVPAQPGKDIKPLKCNICQITFRHIQDFDRHKQIHTDSREKHLCPICQKGFCWKRDVNKHLKRMHSEAKVKETWPCPLCPTKFSRNDSLNSHVKKKHQNEKQLCKKIIKTEPQDATEVTQITNDTLMYDLPETNEVISFSNQGQELELEMEMEFEFES